MEKELFYSLLILFVVTFAVVYLTIKAIKFEIAQIALLRHVGTIFSMIQQAHGLDAVLEINREIVKFERSYKNMRLYTKALHYGQMLRTSIQMKQAIMQTNDKLEYVAKSIKF